MNEEQEQRSEQDAELAVYINDVMSTTSGRAFVWWILSQYRIYHYLFDENPLVLARNEGIRTAGLILLNKVLEVCPEYHNKMLEENRYKEEYNA